MKIKDILSQGKPTLSFEVFPPKTEDKYESVERAAAEIAQKAQVPCQVSLEKRMACGLGACLSCSVDGQDGRHRKVCKDGPVFWAEEVFP